MTARRPLAETEAFERVSPLGAMLSRTPSAQLAAPDDDRTAPTCPPAQTTRRRRLRYGDGSALIGYASPSKRSALTRASNGPRTKRAEVGFPVSARCLRPRPARSSLACALSTSSTTSSRPGVMVCRTSTAGCPARNRASRPRSSRGPYRWSRRRVLDRLGRSNASSPPDTPPRRAAPCPCELGEGGATQSYLPFRLEPPTGVSPLARVTRARAPDGIRPPHRGAGPRTPPRARRQCLSARTPTDPIPDVLVKRPPVRHRRVEF